MVAVRCLVLAGAIAAQAGQGQPLVQRLRTCAVSAGDRRACGGLGTTEEQCKSRGCCFEETEGAGVPACFLAETGAEQACDPSAGSTEECGWQGIGEDACRSRGCCYGPLEPQGAPKCFRSLQARALSEEVSLEGIQPQCVMPDAQRVDCGFVGITPEECSTKECCYYNCTTGHPFCYFKLGMAPEAAVAAARQCEVLDEERIDCGYDGVSSTSCKARGCCYQKAATPGAPFCFYKRHQAPAGAVKGSAGEQCVMPDSDRVDCGFEGVTPEACRAKGCCYFHAHSPGSPFCYYTRTTSAGTAANSSRAVANASRLPPPGACEVPGGKRKDCGFAGISEPECQVQGCCYAHTDVPGAPFCFFRAQPADAPGADGHGHKGKKAAALEAARSARTTAAPEAARSGRTTAAPEAHEGPELETVPPNVLTVEEQTTTGAPGTATAAAPAGGAPLAERIHTDVMGTNHFRGAGTEKDDAADGSRQNLMTMLAAAALLLVIITGCCLRTSPASEDNEENVPLTDCDGPPSPRGAKSKRLEPGSDLYQEFEKQFMTRWNTTSWPTTVGRAVPPPRIAAIYEVDTENRLPAYKAKQREIDGQQPATETATSPGNEQVEFHGARLKCSYQGLPCLDSKCSVCRIVESGSFACDTMGGEIHFRAGSHAAKGQGLAPGKIPPPESLDDFVSQGSGNGVFVANVLLGTPQIVVERTKGRLPPGTHSRVAEKAYGVDEIVVFDEAQAIPRALILFH